MQMPNFLAKMALPVFSEENIRKNREKLHKKMAHERIRMLNCDQW
jgi:hypothetical protein